jgi:hypothetical protein
VIGRRRALLVAGLAVAIAVTPLSSLLNGGVFETWLPAEYGRGPVRVLLHDGTGLVSAAVTYSASDMSSIGDRAGDPRLLVVPWGACGAQADLTFSMTGDGYAIAAPLAESGWCSWFVGSANGITVLTLRAPVDASAVEFLSVGASAF